jgi:hypothetical protein
MENRIAQSVPLVSAPVTRDVVFLSKATPGDDEFALWLAPKLEAAGYRVFTDIRTLEAGDRWRNVITSTLQNQACKMLLCCSDETLAAAGVQEEIEIGLDLAKELKDPRFVIPLRMRPYKKLFGIGGLQYVDFVRGWAEGFEKLLEILKRQKVPARTGDAMIQPNWELYRRRGAIALKQEPERLTSNWLRISEAPDVITYFEPSGVIDRDALARMAPKSPFPVALMQSGFVTFQSSDEMANAAGLALAVFRCARKLYWFNRSARLLTARRQFILSKKFCLQEFARTSIRISFSGCGMEQPGSSQGSQP